MGRARSSRTCAARRRSGAPAFRMPGAVAGRPAASTESLWLPQRRLLDEFTTIRRRNADVNAAINRTPPRRPSARGRGLRRVLGDVSLRLSTKRQTSFVSGVQGLPRAPPRARHGGPGPLGRAVGRRGALRSLGRALPRGLHAARCFVIKVVPGAMGTRLRVRGVLPAFSICRCAMKDDARRGRAGAILQEVLDAHCVGARYRRCGGSGSTQAALPLELFYVAVATNVERNVVLACRLNRARAQDQRAHGGRRAPAPGAAPRHASPRPRRPWRPSTWPTST